MLRLYLFGPLRLVSHGAPHRLRGLPKTQPLLAYLLLHRKQPLKRDRLAYLFWPDATEETARSNLRRHLHDLRKALPSSPPDAPWLIIEGETVRWNPRSPYWLDVAEFERLSATPEGLAPAVTLYSEELLPEIYDDWIFFERERLRDLLFVDLERLTSRYEALGDTKRAISYASQILQHDPLREETARLIMTLHYRAGDRNAALQEYRRIERFLREELGVPPMPETVAAYEAIFQGRSLPENRRPQAGAALLLPPSTLPAQVTPFVGRRQELAELRALLCPAAKSNAVPCRLLTLTGAGGTGKTRLSIELAAGILKEAPDRFADGAWFISLSLITHPNLVIPTIAEGLRVPETARASLLNDVKNHLRDKHLLLLLDNYEHVAEAAGVVAELLAAAPGLSIIVTSRAVLRLYGEQEYPVAPLPLPDPVRLLPLADIAGSPAVALFVDRARAADPSFRLTPENAPAVAEICIRLDGLPLAIELAAARAKLFTPQAMLDRLGSRLSLLAVRKRDLPARQTTLRATIDWSFNLLSEPERELFARLSVFVGGFTLAAAEEIAGTEATAETTLDSLTALVEQSMLRTLPATPPDTDIRFRMLTLLREYAGERLTARDEMEEVHRRHLLYFLALARQGDKALRGAGQLAWLRRLEADHDPQGSFGSNLRAALAWSTERSGRDAHSGLALAAALGWFWYMRGHYSEGNEWLARTMTTAPDAPPLDKALAAKSRALLLSALGRYDDAIPLFHESLGLFAQHPDPIGQGDALNWLGRAEFRHKRYDTAEALCAEAVTVFQAAGDRFGEALALRNMGDVLRLTGRYEEAEHMFQKALESGRVNGGWALGVILNSIGELTRLLGRHARASDIYDEQNGLLRTLGNRLQLAVALHNQGHTVLRLDDPARAAALFRESLSLHQATDNRRGICLCLAGLAGVAVTIGQAERAAQLLGAVSVHLKPLGAHLMGPADQAECDRHLAAVRVALAPNVFVRAWEAGRSMTFDQAVALGISDQPQSI